ncbi:hypothetical protein [Moorena bouillonii]|uniref:hypothetical protein n=1 Tax=Moorena bouillonii TaxID=207920 RepID=UPI0011800E7B|nr:hypothetical protein [Moorena bouillonii]
MTIDNFKLFSLLDETHYISSQHQDLRTESMGRVGKVLPTLQVDKRDRLHVRLDLNLVRSHKRGSFASSRSGGRRPRYANGFAESLFLNHSSETQHWQGINISRF